MQFPRQFVFWAVALGHTANDIFMSMGPVLLVFISANVLPVSPAEIGLTISAQQIFGAASQPLFGWLADARGGRWLGAGGVAWTVSMLCFALVMAAVQDNYLLMAIPFALAALGSGAFHPVGVLYAGADRKQANSNTALFFLFGQLGLAMGPALAGILLSANREMVDGVERTSVTVGTFAPIFVVALFAIPPVLMMATSIPNSLTTRANREKAKNDDLANGIVPENLPLWTKLYRVMSLPILVFVVMVGVRSASQLSAANFIPVLFESKGWTSSEYGIISSVYWLSMAVMGVVLGRLADRYDARFVIAFSLIGGVVPMLLLPASDGLAAFVLAGLVGALTGGAHSIIVIMAQRIIPLGKGLISGLILGYIFVSGAVGTSSFGLNVVNSGLESSFRITAGGIFFAAVLALLLPAWVSGHRRATPEKIGGTEVVSPAFKR